MPVFDENRQYAAHFIRWSSRVTFLLVWMDLGLSNAAAAIAGFSLNDAELSRLPVSQTF
jgi:hypothetical protein